jgi:hypothetical protein
MDGGRCIRAVAWIAILWPWPAPAGAGPQPAEVADFLRQRPAAAIEWRDGRVRRVYGAPLGGGPSPQAAAASFLDAHAPLLGVGAADLVPGAAEPGGAAIVPLMHDARQGGFRLTSLRFGQVAGGVPVFGARLTLVVRNEPGFPLVLVSADLREVAAAPPRTAWAALGTDPLRAALGPHALIGPPRAVVWAGTAEAPAPPRAAWELRVDGGERGTWRALIDAGDGSILLLESEVVHGSVAGGVAGMATADLGADLCGPEAAAALPYAWVGGGGAETFADAEGNYVLDLPGGAPLLLQSRLRGPFFRVFNQAGADAVVSQLVTPPAQASFVHNGANLYEWERAQVNAYLHANRVRDFVLAMHPEYPVIPAESDFPVNVNLNDNCNAFYTTGTPSINFFTSGEDCPNTAFDTIVYHEYGHHLVKVGGSGQGAYGEGMSDAVAVLVTDQPIVGRGWRSDCDLWLRSADNDCQYSSATCTENCGAQAHACGRLISGCVWSLRNELAAVEPATYRATLAGLVLNSILLHTGSSIDPSITIDLLTLDDDNGSILDGTPHYQQVAAAFGAHGMDAPPLGLLGFEFPGGIGEMVHPGAGALAVTVTPLLQPPQPGTGVLHVSTAGPGGPFVELPMVQQGPDQYTALFPPLDCGAVVHFYVSAATMTGAVATWPLAAPQETLEAVAATGFIDAFADDFEADAGWTVASDAGLASGAWERGLPAGGGDRGDPPADGDGSGACFLTGNADGNSDVDGGATTLTSPPLDPGPGHPFVRYLRWYSNAEGDAPMQDTLAIELSGDGGATWAALETLGPGGPDVSGGWRAHRARAADTVALAGALRLRVTASDADPPSLVEAAIDGVRVRSYTCGCAGDVDGNGAVDVGDLVALLLAWGSADPQADLDGSGAVDVGDLVALLLAWGPC